MAAAIRQATGVDPELIAGDKGVFDVVANQRLIFSKHAVGRFPDDVEVIAELASA